MPEPRFAILDIVTVVDGHGPDTGRRGVVIQVRRYPDARYVYGVGWMSDGETGGLYPEEWLATTGQRSKMEDHQHPGTFQIREVVRIGANAAEAIRGKLGHVRAGPAGGADDQYAIWVDDPGEEWMVSGADVEPTGQRLPAPQPSLASSLRVSESGELIGSESYFLLDELDWHL